MFMICEVGDITKPYCSSQILVLNSLIGYVFWFGLHLFVTQKCRIVPPFLLHLKSRGREQLMMKRLFSSSVLSLSPAVPPILQLHSERNKLIICYVKSHTHSDALCSLQGCHHTVGLRLILIRYFY